jgi:hypothetical protein
MHHIIASSAAGGCLQVQATTVTKAELRQQLLSALTTKPGSAARAAGLIVLADSLGLTAQDRASLGLTGAHSSSNTAAAGSPFGSSAAAGGESAGFGLLGEGQSPAAAAGGAAGAYGQGGGMTTPRADGGRAVAAAGRRSVLGRVVGVLFGRGAGDKPAGELVVCMLCAYAAATFMGCAGLLWYVVQLGSVQVMHCRPAVRAG